MTSALLYLGLVLFALACGITIGATLVRDWLDGIFSRQPKPTTLPLARVLTRAEERRLEIPTIKRRQRIEVIR